MDKRLWHTLLGLITGFVVPLIIGSSVGALQGVHPRTFLWNVIHIIPFYNSYFQLGIAVNIGVFFMMMRRESTLFFGRGFLVATILSALWAVIVEI